MSHDVDSLKRQLDAAYAAIEELDDDLAAGRISAADHAPLKEKAERQAAALLTRVRQVDAAPKPAATAPRAPAPASWWRGPGMLTVGAVVLVVAGLVVGVVLGRSTSERPAETAPAAEAVKVSAELEALRTDVEAETTPTKKLLAFGHLALDEGQTSAAIWAYRRVLVREPKNVEAITHMGLILYQGNHLDQALARVEEALAIDPKYAHAHWDRAQILFFGKKDYPAAVRALEAFLGLIPTGEDAERARAMLVDARARVKAGAPAPAAAPPGRRG